MSVMEQTTTTAAATKKSWRDLIKIHPAAELFPMMSEEELKELGEDIKANGLKQPIVFYDDGRGGGGISLLDGRNRLDAMAMVGYHLPLSHSALRDPNKTLRAEGPDGKIALVHMRHEYKDPWGYVVSANLYRRQLTTTQRREVAAKLLKVDPERSNRAIAEQVKLDKNTVQDVRQELEATGEIHQSETRVSASGQKRKAAKKATPRVNPEPAQRVAADAPSPVAKPKQTPAEKPEALSSNVERFIALWDSLSGGERLSVHNHVTSDEWRMSRPAAPQQSEAPPPPTGHTSNRPLIEIKVLARNEWQTKALANEPTNPEEATIRYDALSWELGEIEKRWHELETAAGKTLEDAKRFFPNGRGWQAWVKSHKTCPASSAGVRIALYHAGYKAEGQPLNTMTRFSRWWDELCRDDDNRDLLSELTGELDRLMGKHEVPAAIAVHNGDGTQ